MNKEESQLFCSINKWEEIKIPAEAYQPITWLLLPKGKIFANSR